MVLSYHLFFIMQERKSKKQQIPAGFSDRLLLTTKHCCMFIILL